MKSFPSSLQGIKRTLLGPVPSSLEPYEYGGRGHTGLDPKNNLRGLVLFMEH